MVEEKRPLRGHALHIGVLVLDQACHDRVVDIPEFRNASPGSTIDNLLCRSRCVDDVFRPAEVFGDELALGNFD